MRLQVSAGFADLITEPILSGCHYLSNGIRTPIAVNDRHEWVATLVENAAANFKEATFLVGGWDWRSKDGSFYHDQDTDLLNMRDHVGNQCRSIIYKSFMRL